MYSQSQTGDYNLSKAYAKLTDGIEEPDLTGGSLLYGEFVPDWLSKLPKEEQHQIMLDKITEMMKAFPDVDNWIVVNEPHSHGDYWYKTFGSQYITDAFEKAREVGPTKTLILNGIDSPDNLTSIFNEEEIIPIIKDLKSKGLIDEVGVEAHIDTTKRIPTEVEMIKYFQDIKEKTGLPVRITELDVDMRSISSDQKLKMQAEIYELVITAYIKSGVGTNINFWGVKDKDSWRENPSFGGSREADANLYDDQGNPKIAYYSALRALFDLNE
jgi:endo-1,4-beta-xylanase